MHIARTRQLLKTTSYPKLSGEFVHTEPLYKALEDSGKRNYTL